MICFYNILELSTLVVMVSDWLIGDNMLTALSVARDCGMIETSHKVILVNVVKSPEEKVPSVQFVYAEMPGCEVEEVEYATKVLNTFSYSILFEN